MDRIFEGLRLLESSEILYENLKLRPPQLEAVPFLNFFQIGGEWMKKTFRKINGEALPRRSPPYQELGYFKYGLALWVALLTACLFFRAGFWPAFLATSTVFYLVESQMVFLFPFSIEGVPNPIWESFRQVRKAGGAFSVLMIVLLVAFYMLSGGFFRENLKRSWCVGCLAILVWHLQLKGRKVALHGRV